MSGRLQVANTCGISYTEYMEEAPPRKRANMLDQEAKEIVDNEYSWCESCGLLTHAEEIVNYYNYNGMEYTYDCGAIYSECESCADAEMERLNREYAYMRRGRRA